MKGEYGEGKECHEVSALKKTQQQKATIKLTEYFKLEKKTCQDHYILKYEYKHG